MAIIENKGLLKGAISKGINGLGNIGAKPLGNLSLEQTIAKDAGLHVSTAAGVSTAALLIADLFLVPRAIKGTMLASTENDYNDLMKKLEATGYNGSIKDLMTLENMTGLIDLEDPKYAKGLYLVNNFANADSNSNGIRHIFDRLKAAKNAGNKEERESARALIHDLVINVDSLNIASNYLKDNFETIKQGAIDSISVPAPSYLDTSFVGRTVNETPAQLMTGQEMADLYKVNYDPNYYYDLIKQGTEANVDLARYENEQALNASQLDNVKNMASYLGAMRNTKAEAISSGATEGARAANEVLNNLSAMNNFATGQSEVASDIIKNISRPLLDNSQARITADTYYNSLANMLATGALLNYASDVDRYGQELVTNSELYTADQNLRGQRAMANGTMAGAYANAQANAQANVDKINQYYDYLEKQLRSNAPMNALTMLNQDTLKQYSNNSYNNVLDAILANR